MLTGLTVKILVELYHKYKDRWMERHFRRGKYVKIYIDDLCIEAVIRITPMYDDMLPEEVPDYDQG